MVSPRWRDLWMFPRRTSVGLSMCDAWSTNPRLSFPAWDGFWRQRGEGGIPSPLASASSWAGRRVGLMARAGAQESQWRPRGPWRLKLGPGTFLSMSHWPKQITWPSPKARRACNPRRGDGEVGERGPRKLHGHQKLGCSSVAH